MIYLFGNNSIAENIYDELCSLNKDVCSIIVDDEFYSEDFNHRIKLKITRYSEITFSKDDTVYNCFGYSDLRRRLKIGDRLHQLNILGTFVSLNANIASSVSLAPGTVILGNSTIERNVTVGHSCLLWGGARVCHDTVLKAGVFLASGSVVGGCCEVGEFSSVGFNSSVKEHCIVPSGTKVGANRFFNGNHHE